MIQPPGQRQPAEILAKVERLRQRIEAIEKNVQQGPVDQLRLLSQNDSCGTSKYVGDIALEGRSVVSTTYQGGRLQELDFTRKDFEGICFKIGRSAPTGLRAGACAALGAVSSGLGVAASWCLRQALYSDNELVTSGMTLVNETLQAGQNALTNAQEWVAGPGTPEEDYTHRHSDGSWEHFRLSPSGKIRYTYLPSLRS